jgi:endoribonuclease Dicer
MLEAYIAAIFVDSGFDYTVVEEFFNTHILPYFVDISLYDTFANRQPTVRHFPLFKNYHWTRIDQTIDFPVQPAGQ